jgi:hypothetical protein
MSGISMRITIFHHGRHQSSSHHMEIVGAAQRSPSQTGTDREIDIIIVMPGILAQIITPLLSPGATTESPDDSPDQTPSTFSGTLLFPALQPISCFPRSLSQVYHVQEPPAAALSGETEDEVRDTHYLRPPSPHVSHPMKPAHTFNSKGDYR